MPYRRQKTLDAGPAECFHAGMVRKTGSTAPRFRGFAPFVRADSRILILGSFPSVKSREQGFYYGHPQNRFWRTIAAVRGETVVPTTIPEKKALLARQRIALWDMAAECEIEGSMDSDLRNVRVVDLAPLLERAHIERILLNGRKAESLFLAHCPEWEHLAVYVPSTSPANGRFSLDTWRAALSIG
jgi:hypoxanthine-DNA glycosylase